MKQLLRITAIAIALLFATTTIGQTIDTIFGCDEIPPIGSQPLCTICNFDILYGTTFGFTPSPDAGWCGTVENDQYIGFVAGLTGELVFSINSFACINDNGVQIGIYDQFNNLIGDCFNQVIPGVSQVFTASDLTPAEIYYMRIDGFAGDGCEFNIQVISGLISAGPDVPGPITGPQSGCWDQGYTYSIDPVVNASAYYWRITPGQYTSGASIDPPNATNPLIGTTQLSVEVNLPMVDPTMPLGTCDSILLEVIPLNPCFVSSDTSSFTIEVCRSLNPTDTIFLTGSYSHCDSGYIHVPSGIRYTEGIHYFTNVNASGQFICEETVALTVDVIGSPIVVNAEVSRTACNSNGYINLDISGGIPPYSYTWNGGGGTNPPLTNLDPGTYQITISDAIGCSVTETYRIRDISEENLSLYLEGNDCNGLGGSASISDTINISENYLIKWSTGETGLNIEDLPTGRYSVTIVDSTTGCQHTDFFYITADRSCFSTISGTVLSDNQINCNNPANYAPLAGVMVECSNGERKFTDTNGYYEFRLDTGHYTITVQNIRPASLQPVCATIHAIYIDAYQQLYADNDFYFERTNDPDIALYMVKSSPRRGRTNTITLSACNYDSTTASFSVTLDHTDLQTFVSSTPPYSIIDHALNTVTWNFTDLESYACESIQILLRTNVSTMAGDTVMYMAYTDSTTTSTDATPQDNELSCKEIVIGSFDPNDKLVTPLGQGEEGLIELNDSLLQYTIRFQNTGTDDAWYVRLEDQMSENLDLSTMKILGASHDYDASFNEDRNLIVVFDPILLPPAMTDSLGSQGYFSFTIETIGDLAPGDRIENTADIYFDFNDPIITNTTVNTIRSSSSTREVNNASFVIFPNPTKGELSIHLQEAADIREMRLINIDGRLLPALDFQGAGSEYTLYVNNLGIPQGIYTLRLTLASGEVVHELFVLRP